LWPGFQAKVAVFFSDSYFMRLSSEQFAEIAGTLASGEQLNREKRGATRVPFGRRASVLLQKGRTTAVIREVSVTGASLVASREVPVGGRLVLCVPRLQGLDLQVNCSVLRCERCSGEHVFIVGLKFEEVLPDRPLDVPGAATAAGKALDVTRIKQAMLG